MPQDRQQDSEFANTVCFALKFSNTTRYWKAQNGVWPQRRDPGSWTACCRLCLLPKKFPRNRRFPSRHTVSCWEAMRCQMIRKLLVICSRRCREDFSFLCCKTEAEAKDLTEAMHAAKSLLHQHAACSCKYPTTKQLLERPSFPCMFHGTSLSATPLPTCQFHVFQRSVIHRTPIPAVQCG